MKWPPLFYRTEQPTFAGNFIEIVTSYPKSVQKAQINNISECLSKIIVVKDSVKLVEKYKIPIRQKTVKICISHKHEHFLYKSVDKHKLSII